jgi:hypothetical protein
MPADDKSASRRLPKNLYEATEAMAAPDSYARKVFGDAFVDHFAATRVRRRRALDTATSADTERTATRMGSLLVDRHDMGAREVRHGCPSDLSSLIPADRYLELA